MKKIFSIFAAVLFAGSMMADVTVTKSIHDLFPNDANGTQEATLYSDAVLSISVNSDGNNGKVYGTGTEWRLYQSNNAVVTVAATNATIKTVAFEFTVKNTGVLNFNAVAMTSNTAVHVNAASAEFVVANSGAATNGQVIIKGFTVVYEASSDVPPVEDDCNWEEIAFLGNGSGNDAYTNRFKICAGDPAPTDIVNIQAPAWAGEPGIYVAFPSAAFGAISLDEDQYAIDGAGMLLYVSAFLYDAETEVTIVCQEVTYTLTVKNVNPETAPVVIPQYEVAEAIAAGLADDTEIEVRGIITRMEMKGKNFAKYGSVNIYVADATGAEGVFEFYNCYSLAADTFRTTVPAYDDSATAFADVTEVTDNNGLTIHVGDTVIAHGNYTYYTQTSMHELKQGCYLVYAKAPGAPYPTDIDNTAAEQKAIKLIENGQLFIIKNGVRYNAQGAVVR